MSINSLTRDSLAQRASGANQPKILQEYNGADSAGSASPAAGTNSTNVVDNSLNRLIKYIPTEIVTLYVAIIAAATALKVPPSQSTLLMLYVAFAVLTALSVILVFLGKLATDGQDWPSPRGWPWWNTIAATIAFLVWGLALPNNQLVSSDLSAAFASIGALAVSYILSMFEPVAQRLGVIFLKPRAQAVGGVARP